MACQRKGKSSEIRAVLDQRKITQTKKQRKQSSWSARSWSMFFKSRQLIQQWTNSSLSHADNDLPKGPHKKAEVIKKLVEK